MKKQAAQHCRIGGTTFFNLAEIDVAAAAAVFAGY